MHVSGVNVKDTCNSHYDLQQDWPKFSARVTKMSINFKEILSGGHGNFERAE
jgi:hypothetical protein